MSSTPSPLMRYGIGFLSALVPATVALVLLDGTMQLLVLAIAVLDVLAVPWVLKHGQ